MRLEFLCTFGAAAAIATGAAHAAAALPPLTVDATKITVSGRSAGGFMANQFVGPNPMNAVRTQYTNNGGFYVIGTCG